MVGVCLSCFSLSYRNKIGRKPKLKPTENWWLIKSVEQFGEEQPAALLACSPAP
jgi:hypothetical protein